MIPSFSLRTNPAMIDRSSLCWRPARTTPSACDRMSGEAPNLYEYLFPARREWQALAGTDHRAAEARGYLAP